MTARSVTAGAAREEALDYAVPMLNTPDFPGRQITHAAMIHTSAVGASNIIRDLRENIRNLFGGKMRSYEHLIQITIDRAFVKLSHIAAEQGYDAVINVRVATAGVTEGGAEIIVYGTAVRLAPR